MVWRRKKNEIEKIAKNENNGRKTGLILNYSNFFFEKSVPKTIAKFCEIFSSKFLFEDFFEDFFNFDFKNFGFRLKFSVFLIFENFFFDFIYEFHNFCVAKLQNLNQV